MSLQAVYVLPAADMGMNMCCQNEKKAANGHWGFTVQSEPSFRLIAK